MTLRVSGDIMGENYPVSEKVQTSLRGRLYSLYTQTTKWAGVALIVGLYVLSVQLNDPICRNWYSSAYQIRQDIQWHTFHQSQYEQRFIETSRVNCAFVSNLSDSVCLSGDVEEFCQGGYAIPDVWNSDLSYLRERAKEERVQSERTQQLYNKKLKEKPGFCY